METAVQPCVYHEDRPAVDTCSECKAGICEECRQEVAGHTVCSKCVEDIRSRVSAQIDSEPEAVTPTPVASTVDSAHIPTAQSVPIEMDTAPSVPTAPVAPPAPARILLGILLGLVAGAVGAFIRAQVMHRANIQFGLIDSFIGFAVGFAVVLGSGRSGIVPAIIGAVIAFGAITYGWHLWMGYEMNEMISKIGTDQGVVAFSMPPFLESAPRIIKGWDVMDWVFVAIGVYGGFITPMRAGSPATGTI